MKLPGLSKSSKTLTTSTDEKLAFTTSDICQIMEAGAKSRVSELKFKHLDFSLELCFGKPTASPDLVEATELTSAQHAKQNQQAFVVEEAKARSEQVERMLIDNPAEAERLIAEGDLVDDDDSGDSDND